MKTLCLFTLLATAAPTLGYAQQASSAAATRTETRSLAAFSAIDVTDGIRLEVRAGQPTAAVVDASTPQLRSFIKTEVEGGVLKVYFDASADRTWKGLVNSHEHFLVTVTTGELHELKAARGAAVTLGTPVSGTDALAVRLRSGATLGGAVQVQALDIQLREGAVAHLSGSANTLRVRAIEGSRFRSPDLKTNQCTAYATSASVAQVAVSKTLEASAANQGTIIYSGAAELTQNSHEDEGGKIKHK
jgi:hypothetical protein